MPSSTCLNKFAPLGLLLALAACGGGGGNSAAVSPPSYAFSAPHLNAQALYALTTIDDSNNTISQSVREVISSVNSDGTYGYVQDDPTHNVTTVNNTTYSIRTQAMTDNKSGQLLSYSYTSTGGSAVLCTATPHGAGPTYPLTVGQTWSDQYVVSCDNNTQISYTQTGTVSSVESVTVPAGTFSAVKLQSTLNWSDAAGTVRSETITTWRDVPTSNVLKRITNTNYSGTIPLHGRPVMETLQLVTLS